MPDSQSHKTQWGLVVMLVWAALSILALMLLSGCSGGKYYQSQPMDSQIGSDVSAMNNSGNKTTNIKPTTQINSNNSFKK